MPKGITLAMGLLSMMLPAGVPVITLLMGSTMREPGATPKVHCVMAPVQTCCPMRSAFHQLFEPGQQTRLGFVIVEFAALGIQS